VGWRDRDWAKFDDDELRTLLGPASAPARRARQSTVARRTTSAGTLLAVAVSAAAIIFVTHLHELGRPGDAASRVLTPAPRVAAPPADVVGIRWRPTDTAPAANAGRICVTDPHHGRICASYVVGERPADTLTREIERLGLHVRSSG
jgi:hypothetical protein